MKLINFQFLSDGDQHIWDQINATEVEYDDQGSIIDMFYRAVARDVARPAISIAGQDLSYAELNQRSNQIAHFLIANGLRAGDTVAVAFTRTHHLYVAIMGILKAGGVYVPVEPDDPLDRIQYMFDHARVTFLLTEQAFVERHGAHMPGTMIKAILDAGLPSDTAWFDAQHIAGYPADDVAVAIDPRQPMYIIFTSGTTGRPKGVKISHASVINFTRWVCDVHKVTYESRFCQNAPITFDPSVQQIFPALTTGAALLPIPEPVLLDPYLLLEWLRDERITHLDIVTSHWVHMLNALDSAGDPALGHLPDLQWVIIGGESLYYHQTHLWSQLTTSPVKFNNIYGPTEATINATMYLVDFDRTEGKIPIGHPLPNYKIYILDRNGNLCPPGITGEIYIGGLGVALGYQDAEQTRKAFIADPFSPDPNALLYKTGDLGVLRVEPDGESYFEFGGRIDSQIKISGYRIELEEIEAVIKTLPEIQDTAVAVWGEEHNKQLVCFFVSPALESADLRRRLRETLPHYMVPGAYVKLDALFYTRNGKMDTKKLLALYEQQRQEENRVVVAPRTAMERDIAAIWKHLLNYHEISVDDNVFDLGASSFLTLSFLTQLQAKVQCACRIADIYNHPTIAELASFLEDAQRKQHPRVWTGSAPAQASVGDAPAVVPVTGIDALIAQVRNPGWSWQPLRRIEMSPANRRVVRGGIERAQQTIIDVQLGFPADPEILARVVQDILAAHPLLRTAIRTDDDGTLWFEECGLTTFQLPYLDLLDDDPQAAQALDLQLATLAETQLDLTRPPLFQLALIRLAADRFRFFWSISHVISDGETITILMRELQDRYYAYLQQELFAVPPAGPGYDAYVQAIRATPETGLAAHTTFLERFMSALDPVAPMTTTAPVFFNRVITLDAGRLGGQDTAAIDTLYALCGRIVAAWLGVELVPFMSHYHGRVYHHKSYFTLAGNLTDLSPILVAAGGGSPAALQFWDSTSVNFSWLLERLHAEASTRSLAARAEQAAYPLWLSFFEEPELVAPDEHFRLFEHAEEYQRERHGSIHFAITKSGMQFSINLFGWGIAETAMEGLYAELERQITSML